MIMPMTVMTVMTVMTTWTRVFPLAAHSRSSTVSIKWRIGERLCRRRKNLPLLSDTLTFHIFTIVLLRGFFSTFLSLIHLWSRSRFSLISSESRKCQQSRKIVQWKPWKPNIDCWKRGYIAWFELTKMALWPYSQMHAFPKVDVFSKKSNLYLCTKSAWKYLEKQVKLFLRPIQVVRITLSMAKKSLGRDFVQTPVNPHLFRLRLYFFQIRITALMMNIMLIVDPQDRQWWKINISAMAKFFLLLLFPELVFSPVFSRPFF